MADRNDAILKLMEKPLGPEDTFRFRCKQCGSCCRDRIDILLSPFDLCRMAKELDEPLQNVFEKYGHAYIGSTSNVPLVSLKMREDNGKCHLLRDDNRCRIQKNKPAVCALFPLGRCAAKKDSGTEIFYILQPTDCGDRDEDHTPKEWMGEFNLEESEEWFRVWQDIVSTLSEKITEVLPKVSGELENALFTGIGGLLYLKYDIEKPLLPQVKENGAKALGIVSGIDDMMKMFGH